MKYAIISDVHANESALRHVLQDAAALGAEQVICLGDVVGYGPLPKEALALLRKSATVVLAGNHDDAVSGRLDANDFIDLAGDAVQRHREALNAEELAWLGKLPRVCRIEGAVAAHGDFTDPPAFNYVEDEASATANFNANDAQLMFVGHTHVPCLFLTGRSGQVYRVEPQDFTLEGHKRYIVNPGSVGYPRESNGTCLSSYVLYDSTERAVNFRFLPFAVSSVMQRGRNPHRRLGLLLGAILLGGAAIAASLYFSFHEKAAEKTTIIQVQQKEDPALILDRKSLTLTRSHQNVRANLKLDRKHDPVTLVVEFKNTTGEKLDEITETVKGSSAKAFKIPQGAISAHFLLRKRLPADTPQVLAFSPSAE